jgi:hypothetical protein
VGDAALRDVDALRRVTEIHAQRALDNDKGFLLERVPVAPSLCAGRVAPEVPARVLPADVVAQPGDVARRPASFGLALDPVELIGADYVEGHGASVMERGIISVVARLLPLFAVALLGGASAAGPRHSEPVGPSAVWTSPAEPSPPGSAGHWSPADEWQLDHPSS